jgi:hypothetical protein
MNSTTVAIRRSMRIVVALYRFEFGDGGVIHGGPGEPGPPGASEISHLYQARGWYDLTVEVGWRVTFEVNGRTADPDRS